MNLENRIEILERCRLYGEILMLVGKIFKETEFDDFSVEYEDLVESEEQKQFDVETDAGDKKPFNGIEFLDGMLWVDYGGNISVQFLEVKATTLLKIYYFLRVCIDNKQKV